MPSTHEKHSLYTRTIPAIHACIGACIECGLTPSNLNTHHPLRITEYGNIKT